VIWNPLAVGEPPVRGNSFRDYFPGSRFFDAYGNDYYDFGTYSFVRTNGLYKAYPSKPFVVPEWGVALDDPGFVRAFASFVRSHRRVKFIGFYNGRTGGRLDIGHASGRPGRVPPLDRSAHSLRGWALPTVTVLWRLRRER